MGTEKVELINLVVTILILTQFLTRIIRRSSEDLFYSSFHSFPNNLQRMLLNKNLEIINFVAH